MRALEPVSLGLRLRARPECAAILRERVRMWLEELGATSDDVFAVSLAITEAFGNAVEHPRGPSACIVEIEGTLTDRTITVRVRDFGSWQTERHRREGGYGFPLMRSLMEDVEVVPWAEGTAVTMHRRLGSD